jgi:hypothetical protein
MHVIDAAYKAILAFAYTFLTKVNNTTQCILCSSVVDANQQSSLFTLTYIRTVISHFVFHQNKLYSWLHFTIRKFKVR